MIFAIERTNEKKLGSSKPFVDQCFIVGVIDFTSCAHIYIAISWRRRRKNGTIGFLWNVNGADETINRPITVLLLYPYFKCEQKQIIMEKEARQRVCERELNELGSIR